MFRFGLKYIAGLLIVAGLAVAGSAGPVFAKTADGAAEGLNLQAAGDVVNLGLPLVSVEASGVGEFDESDEILGVNETLPLLGTIVADVISASTRHVPFDHQVESEALASGLEVDLGVNVLGLVDIPVLGLTSGTIASEAGVTGACDGLVAAGGATIEDLTISVLGLDQGVAVPINPPPNFEALDVELTVPIGIASVTAQVLVIANEQDIAADESDIMVNALRVTIGLEITVGLVTVEQDINLVVANSQAGFSDCNEVDLSVEKTTDLDGNAVTGEPFSYTVTVGNNSVVDATIIEITDLLPPELEFIAFGDQSGGDCTHDSGLITCQWLTIPAGTGVSVSYEVLPVAAGTVTNSVGVSTGDVNIGDPGDEVEIIIDKAVDLVMEKSIDNEPLVVGQAFNYVFDYTNNGVNDAIQVDFADLVPEGIAITAAPAGGDCTVDGDPASFPFEGDGMTVLVCVIAITVPSDGGTAQVLLPAMPLAQAEGTTPINYASWSDDGDGDPADPDPGTCETDPNCDTSEPEDPVQPAPFVDLDVEMSIDSEPLIVGQPFDYVFTYTNNGNTDATQVDFAALLPFGIEITGPPNGGTCTVDGMPAEFPVVGDDETMLVCVVDANVAADGGMAVVTLPAVPTEAGELPVIHVGWSDEGSGNPEIPNPGCADNINCATAAPADPIGSGVELVMEKSIDNEPLVVGQAFNYVFDYTNNGVNDATQVDFADLVPEGIFITSAPAGGMCTVDGATAQFPVAGDGETVLVCVVAVTVPAGGGAQVLLSAVPVAQAEGTTPINYASWSDDGDGDPTDPDPGTCETDPNCDTSEPEGPVQPAPASDLAVTISVDPDPGVEDEPLTYSVLIANEGTGTAEGVTMELDFGGVPVTIDESGLPDGCMVSGTQVTCGVGDIGPGNMVEIQIVVTPEGTGTLVVQGSVEDAEGNVTPISSTTTIVESVDNDIFSDRFEQQ